jgi:hypothetical protein
MTAEQQQKAIAGTEKPNPLMYSHNLHFSEYSNFELQNMRRVIDSHFKLLNEHKLSVHLIAVQSRNGDLSMNTN